MSIKTKSEQFVNFLHSGSPSAIATNVVIVLVALSGVVVIAGIAPGIFAIAKQFKGGKRHSPKQMEGAYYNLKKSGCIETKKQKDGKTKLVLTKKGRIRAEKIIINQIIISKPKKWDRAWFIVMFDIPTKFSKGRDALRFHLKRLGFYQLQKSVWIFPYKCENEIITIADFFRVKKYVAIAEINNISCEKRVKKYFDL